MDATSFAMLPNTTYVNAPTKSKKSNIIFPSLSTTCEWCLQLFFLGNMLMLDTGVELSLGLSYLIPGLTNEGGHWKLIKAPKQLTSLNTPSYQHLPNHIHSKQWNSVFPFWRFPYNALTWDRRVYIECQSHNFGTQCANHYLEFGKF
jgi:hypothetical protein